MDFMTLLVQDGLAIAAGLFILGIFIKQTPVVPDWLIPWALVIVGVIAAGCSMEGGFTVRNMLQGVYASGAAVLTNQLGKQTTLKNPGSKFMTLFGGNEESKPVKVEAVDKDGGEQ